MTLSAELRLRVFAAVQREPSPARPRVLRRLAAIGVAALALDGALLLWLGVHRGARPLGFLLAAQGGSACVALLSAWAAFARERSLLARSRRWSAVALATPLALLFWLSCCDACCPEAAAPVPERIGLRCLLLSLSLASWPLLLLLRARREVLPEGAFAAGAARGSALGALAWVLVACWCPVSAPAHLALGHFLPVLLLAVLGGWYGRRVAGVRCVTSRATHSSQ